MDQLKTPVLFIIFNKIDETKKVFYSIRDQKPKKLFIAADGPRPNIEFESERCNYIRKWVIDNIDWPCEVFTLFREENVGCGYGPSVAISWFFENVFEGIILEDDCLPNNSFFKFCEQLLETYRNNSNISAISGNNFMGNMRNNILEDYYFSIFPSSWGWATWKRSWDEFSFDIEEWGILDKQKFIKFLFKERCYSEWWKNQFDWMLKCQPKDMWDFQFHFHSMKNKRLAIIPKLNLVSNIGHGPFGTHFSDLDNHLSNIERFELKFPIRHPKRIVRSYYNDVYVQKCLFGQVEKESFFKKIKQRIKKIVKVIYRQSNHLNY